MKRKAEMKMDLGSIIVTTLLVLFMNAAVFGIMPLFPRGSWMPIIIGGPLGYGLGMLLLWIVFNIGEPRE